LACSEVEDFDCVLVVEDGRLVQSISLIAILVIFSTSTCRVMGVEVESVGLWLDVVTI
jgi:hypothetical protein